VSSSELASIESLLFQVLPDPMGFAERVLGELAERLDVTPPGEGATVIPTYESDAHEALVDRDLLLAAALGACDCWGEDPGCPTCGGRGTPGWMPPDPELYADYVEPAVRRTTQDEPPADGGGTPITTDPGPDPGPDEGEGR
jgi:hypothetical protein